MSKQKNKNHIIEKKAVEEKMNFFSAVVEQSTEGMALADLKGNIIFVNKAWTKMHGHKSSKSLLGVNLAIFHSKKQLRNEVNSFNKKVKRLGTYSGEVGHVTKKGIEFPTLMTSTLLKDKDNKPFALLGIAKDITNRKEVQRRLEESEKRFRDISMNIADWIWEVDAEGKYTFVAGKIKNILGYSPEELIGKTPFDFMPSKEASRIGKIFKGIIAKKQDIVDLENINFTKSGQKVIILTNGSPLLDDKGGLIGYRGVDKDITKKKEAEDLLAQSEQKFKTLIDFTYGWEYWIDNNSSFIYVSPSCERITGYKALEFYKNRGLYKKIIHPDDRNYVFEHKHNLPGSLEFRIITRKKEVRWISHTCQKVIDAKGVSIGRRGSNRDVTEQKITEQKIKDYAKIFEDSLNEIYIFDAKSYKFIHANQGAQKNIGYSLDELKKITPLDIKDEFTLASFSRLIKPLKEKKKNIIVFETEHKRKDGSFYNVEVHLQLTKFEKKSVFVAIILDITKRKEAEKLIKEAKEFTDNAIDAQVDTFFVFDPKTRKALRWNKSFEKISGYSSNEISKMKAPYSYYSPEDLKKANKGLKNLSKSSKETIEISLITKKGKKIPFEYRISFIESKNEGAAIISIGRDITERKEANKKLRKSEEEYRSVIENSRDAIYRMSLPGGKYSMMSSAAKDVFGYGSKNFLDNSLFIKKIIHPEFKKYFKENWNKLLKGKILDVYEYKIIDNRGKERWINQSNRGVFDEKGKIVAIEGICRNITVGKEAEDVIRESEARFRGLFESANDAIFLMKEEFIDCNPATLKMFGCKYNQIVGHSPIEFSPLLQPDGKKSSIRAKKRIKEAFGGKPQRFYWQHKKLNGTLFDAEISLNRVDLPGGAYVQAIVRDISKEKKAEVKIKEVNKELEEQQSAILNVVEDIEKEKQKAETYLNIAGNIIVILDNKGKIKLINKKGSEILGYKEGELINQDWFGTCCLPKENIKEVRGVFKKLMQGKIEPVEYYENPIVTKSGERRIIGWHNSLLKDEVGNIIGVLSSGEDLTKIKEIDKAKTEFVSLASHQLRTPLSAIHWYTGMLLEGDVGELNKKQKAYVDKIHISNVRMIDLINALLNVSRLELGTFAVETSIVDVIDIAKSVIGELNPSIKEKGISIKKQFDKKIPKKIKLDKRLIRIIIQNLLSNAIKYTPNKGNVSIKMAKNDKDIKITVSDNGYGIPRFQQDQIFTKLFRADNIKVRDTDGTGLGLYLAKEILEHMGGKIWFKSQENKGSTFYVTFPLKGIKAKKGTRKLEYIK